MDERGTASFVEESEPAHGGTCCVAVLIALVVHIQKRRTSERSSATDLVAGNNERAMKNKSSGIWTSQSYIVSKILQKLDLITRLEAKHFIRNFIPIK